MKHTKGPWKIDAAGFVSVGKEGDVNTYTVIADPLHENGPNEEEAEANAKLIAAAPELLEALQAVYSDINLDKNGSSELNIIVQRAIQKATGAN